MEESQDVDYLECSFVWNIEGFSSHTESNFVFSRKIILPFDNDNLFSLDIQPFSKQTTHLSIDLTMKTKKRLRVFWTIKLTDKAKKIFFFKQFDAIFNPPCCSFNHPDIVKRSNILPLKDDTLMVECWFNFKPCTKFGCFDYYSIDYAPLILECYEKLLSSANLSDIILQASDGTDFPAHKCILATHSPVFKAMFVKNENNKIIIKDFDKDVVKAMLEFMYALNFKKTQPKMEQLFVASNVYDIKYLRDVTKMELCKKLTVETAVEYLLLADTHASCVLREESLDFIKNNIDDIIEKDTLTLLVANRPKLLKDIIKALCNKG